MRFANPVILILLVSVPMLFWYYHKQKKQIKATIGFSSLNLIKKAKGNIINRDNILVTLRMVVISLLILGFARPQSGQKSEEITTKGIDIMLILDTSSSMLAEDFRPNNRLSAAKQVAKEFVKGRKNDRMGIVVFSAVAFTQCPLTLDYGAVVELLDNVEIGMTQTDGTAIGTAIATAVNRMKGSEAKSKIIILLTDGRNNTGEIDPTTAAKAAQALDIKIYTIGAGAPGGAMYPVDDPIFGKRYVKMLEDLDEVTLRKIADITEGLYFRAKDTSGLSSIYKQIDKMEKTEIKIEEYVNYTELFPYFVFPAFVLFFTEIALANTYLRKIP